MKRRTSAERAVPRLPDIFSDGTVGDWLEREEPQAWAAFLAMSDGPDKHRRMPELSAAARRLRGEAFRAWIAENGLSWADARVRPLMPRGPVFWIPRAERLRELVPDEEKVQ